MYRAALLTITCLAVVLGGCINDPATEEEDPPMTSAVDAEGRTITEVEVGDALVHVHAAAGAVSHVMAKTGTVSATLPAAFWIKEDGRFVPGSTTPHDLAAGETVEFLVTPFTEAFDVVLSAGGSDQTVPVLAPYNETASFVSGGLVYELLEVQRDRFPHRTPGQPNYEAAQDYFVELLKSWGYETVVKDEFGLNDLPQPDGAPLGIKPQSMANVYAYRPGTGTPDRIVAFGGHYDAIEATKEAAFDDTSGTVMTLALAKAFSEIETDVGLLFGLWGGEEDGLLGSNFFVRTHPDLVAQTVLYVNLDVAAMAWPGPYGVETPILVASGPDGVMADALEAQARQLYATYVPELPEKKQIYETVAEGQATGAGVNAQSDHTSFMSEGVPVYFPFTSDVETVFAFIHKPADTLHNMTYYMGTGEKFDMASGENPAMNETVYERGRMLNIRSFETFMALGFYSTLELDSGVWSSPKDVPA